MFRIDPSSSASTKLFPSGTSYRQVSMVVITEFLKQVDFMPKKDNNFSKFPQEAAGIVSVHCFYLYYVNCLSPSQEGSDVCLGKNKSGLWERLPSCLIVQHISVLVMPTYSISIQTLITLI